MNAMAAPRPCRHAGCHALVRDGSGYCPAQLARAGGQVAGRKPAERISEAQRAKGGGRGPV